MTQPQQPSVEELKECPFCKHVQQQPMNNPDAFAKDGKGKFCVVCDECGAMGPMVFGTVQCIEAWNHRTSPSPAEVSSEGLPKLPDAGYVRHPGGAPCLYDAEQMQTYARQALSQQSPATVEGALTDEEITALAQEHLKAFAQFGSQAGEVWVEGEIEFARAIERALNQRLAVKEGPKFLQLRAMFIANMLRFMPDKTKHEIAAEIDKALSAHPAPDDQQAKDAALYAVYHTEEHVGSFFQGVFSSEVFARHWIDRKSPYPANECFIRPVQLDVPLCAALSTTKQEEV